MPGWIARLNRRLMSLVDENKQETYVQEAYRLETLAYHQRILSRLGIPLAGASILDVGCGPGHWLKACAAHGPRLLVGSDISVSMLRAARKGGSQHNMVFFRGDAMSVPMRSDAFDVVICSLVLPYVPSDHAVIAELVRVCKPGGRLLISFHGLGFYLHHIIAQRNLKYIIVPPISWLSFITGHKLLWNTYQSPSGVRRLLTAEGYGVADEETDWRFWGFSCITHVIGRQQDG